MLKLPNATAVVIDPRKIRDYLLDITHKKGGAKAREFIRYGFERSHWPVLSLALLAHVFENPAYFTRVVQEQERWAVEGPLSTPIGKRPLVRSVWAMKNGVTPHLLSAYKIPKVKNDLS